MVSISVPVREAFGTEYVLELPVGIINKTHTALDIIKHIEQDGRKIIGDMIVKLHK